MYSAMIISHRIRGCRSRIRSLQATPDRIGSGLGTISAVRLIQNVSNVRSYGIEADCQHQRDVLVRPSYRKQTQNLDFASRELVRKRDTAVSATQQGIDIDNQARHFKSTRELLGIAQLLQADAPLRLVLARNEKSTVAEQRASQERPRPHCAI